MALVESDDVIEQIAAAASYPALSDSVLPGTSNGGSQTRESLVPGLWDFGAEANRGERHLEVSCELPTRRCDE